MSRDPKITRSDLLTMSAQVAAAYASNHEVEAGSVPSLIQSTFETLAALADATPVVVEQAPAVPIRRSVTDDYIICLEDGRKLKMLKRHLMASYDMTPEQYRAKWRLPGDYPMVAPSYARTRQDLAKKNGLGRKPVAAAAAKPKRARAKAAA